MILLGIPLNFDEGLRQEGKILTQNITLKQMDKQDRVIKEP